MTSIEKLSEKIDEIREMVHKIDLSQVEIKTQLDGLKRDSENQDKEIKDLRTGQLKAKGAIGLLPIIFALYELLKK